MTDPLGQSQVLPYLIGLYATEGYQFHLISCEKPERYVQQKDHIAQLCAAHHIIWHPLPYTKRPPIASTLYDLYRIGHLAHRLHQNEQFDAVHCRSYLPALIGKRLKQRYGVKFVFDMRGFWADERVDGNLWQQSNPLYRAIYRYFKRQERAFLTQADAVVSLTHAAVREMATWNLPPLPIYVIPCCTDTNLFDPNTIDPSTRLQLRLQCGISPQTIVLGYVGSIGTWYMLDEMLDFFKVWVQYRPDSKFLFVTNEGDLVRQKAIQKNISLEQFVIVSALRHEVPAYLSLFDYSVFFIRPTYSKISSSPVKHAEIMAMGIPVVANSGIGDTDQLVQPDTGVLLPLLTTAEYERAAAQLLNSQFDRQHIRAQALCHFDLQNGIRLYACLYRAILQP